MQTSRIREYQNKLIDSGVEPKLARQAATVLANDSLSLPRTERGKRIVLKAYSQVRW